MGCNNEKRNILQAIIAGICRRGLLRWLPGKQYLTIYNYGKTGKLLDWNHLETLGEKLHWLSIYDRNPIYTSLVDKVQVKEIVGKQIGYEHIIPTIGVWNQFEDIDFEKLPERFVLKCNHNSACIAFCTNKDKFDSDSFQKKFKKALKTNKWYVFQEWPYKNVVPKILAEPFMENEKDEVPGLIDYKFYCFHGEPKFLYVRREQYLLSKKSDYTEMNFLDMEYNLLPVNRIDCKSFDELPRKPKSFDKMKEIARILSKPFAFIRVDLYEVNGNVYFGELTFKPTGGFMKVEPNEYDYLWGSYLDLSKVKNGMECV